MNITWGKTISVWWSAAWRGVLYGFIGGFVLGFIGGFAAALTHTPDKAAIYGMIGGYIAAIPASILALKQALSKHLASLVAIANKASN